MIHTGKDEYAVECDICGKYEGGFGSFDEAVEYIRDNEWDTRKVDGEYHNHCDECKELN